MMWGIERTDLSFLVVAAALASLLIAWILAGRHWKAPDRIRRRPHATPTGALNLLQAAETSGRYADVIQFAERQLVGTGPGTSSATGHRRPDKASRQLSRRLRRLDRQMRWSSSPWWPSLDLWRSAEDRRAGLELRLESVLRDVNVHAEANGGAP